MSVHSGTLPAYPYMIKLYERPSGLYSSDSHEEIDLYPVKISKKIMVFALLASLKVR